MATNPGNDLIDLDSSKNHPNNTSSGSTTDSTLQSAKDTLVNTTSSTMSAIQNHPATQQAKDAIVNGPVGQTVQEQSAKTSSEFKDLANSKQVPDHPAATGQPLTHYHSLFYRLLSWKNPRATSIVFASIVALIFAARYLDALRYIFKALYTVLGITAAAEIAGKAAIGDGFATKLRPRKYYTIRKESLERFLDDFEQLVNFGVIEAQRIVFAENIWVTVGAFFSSFLGYWLIKWLPLWGLTLLSTTIAFLGPLVYVKNQAFIDEHINHAGHLINAQATQVRDLAAQHTSQATETFRSYAGEYSHKAQQLINDARGKATNGSAGNTVNPDKFPAAPKTEPVAIKKEPGPQAEPVL